MSDTKILTITAQPFADAMKAHYCADAERTRVTLAGVAILRETWRSCIVATDGKVLIEFDMTTHCVQEQGEWPASIIIPAADAKILAKMKPKKLTRVILTIERHSDKITVEWEDKKGAQSHEIKPISGSYPNYLPALHDPDQAPQKTNSCVGLNMGNLERIHKAIGGTVKTPVSVIITDHGKNTGLMITTLYESNVRALIMRISLPTRT